MTQQTEGLTTGVRLVAFDVYGTLIDLNGLTVVTREFAGAQANSVAEAWRRWQLQYSWLRALAGQWRDFIDVTRDALDSACREHDIGLTPASQRAAIDAYLALAPAVDAAAVLNAIRSRGIATAVLSNGGSDMVATSLRNAGLYDLIDHVLTADLVGTYKPHPSIYELPRTRLGVGTPSVVLVTANAWDAGGAAAADMHVRWLARAEQVPVELVEGSFTQLVARTTWSSLVSDLDALLATVESTSVTDGT
jgi:2-haloacid dehalogenase